MRKKHAGILLLSWVSGLLLFLSCQPAPEFSNEPRISFSRLEIREIAGSSFDSLIVFINIQDGNGDLGLRDTETFFPFHPYAIFIDPITRDTLKYRSNDTLPEFNCEDYEIIRRNTSAGPRNDTIFVIRNPNHFNFFLDFLVEENGVFRLYNWARERCTPNFHGRFPLLSDRPGQRPIEAELRYGIRGGFRLLFRNNALKLRISIKDRDLNQSNIVETEPFMINDIIMPAR